MIIKNTFQLFLLIALLSFSNNFINAQLPKKGSPKQWIYGLTIEHLEKFSDADLVAFQNSFDDVAAPITLRILFQAETLPFQYKKLKTLYESKDNSGNRRFYIMALLFDSQALRDYKVHKDSEKNFSCSNFTTDNMDYNQRTKCFVEEFRNYVDVWEVGNEVNGEWADVKYNDETKKNPNFKGNYKETIKKIDTAISLVPNDKPLALTISYMPDCGEWNDNKLENWIKHFKKNTIEKIDYVLISYYEDKCEDDEGEYKVLDEQKDINDDALKSIRMVFKNQFIGFGELGYSLSDDKDENTIECSDTKNCYCHKTNPNIRKSKISQIQRYYRMQTNDNVNGKNLFVGGGFWWNAGEDYIVSDFLTALKNQFKCLSENQECVAPLPVDCPLPR